MADSVIAGSDRFDGLPRNIAQALGQSAAIPATTNNPLNLAPGQAVRFTADPTVGGDWTHTRADVPLFRNPPPAPPAAQPITAPRSAPMPSPYASPAMGAAAQPRPQQMPTMGMQPRPPQPSMPPIGGQRPMGGQPPMGNQMPQGNAYGHNFREQYGQAPGQMRDQWNAYRQQNGIGGGQRPDIRALLSKALMGD